MKTESKVLEKRNKKT